MEWRYRCATEVRSGRKPVLKASERSSVAEIILVKMDGVHACCEIADGPRLSEVVATCRLGSATGLPSASPPHTLPLRPSRRVPLHTQTIAPHFRLRHAPCSPEHILARGPQTQQGCRTTSTTNTRASAARLLLRITKCPTCPTNLQSSSHIPRVPCHTTERPSVLPLTSTIPHHATQLSWKESYTVCERL